MMAARVTMTVGADTMTLAIVADGIE
jgi:hypothetical protein